MVQNVPPTEVWEALMASPDAQLIDVRTDAEWTYVGLPDLSAADKQPLLIAWQTFPSGQRNHDFVEQLHQAGLTHAHPLYFICRSGVRSLAAAEAAQEAGFPLAYNVADGFQGPLDRDGHRDTLAGWRAAGLPWRQG